MTAEPGHEAEPVAYCAMGIGREKLVIELIRPNGRAFKNARNCEFFSSMSDSNGE